MRIQRCITEPIRKDLSWHERWTAIDKGLIACWERGREKQLEAPALAERARKGQLVILPWKGGVEKAIKAEKYGTFNYLAMWQGLRGENLDVDPDTEITLECAESGQAVTFTSDVNKYAPPEPEK